MVSGLRRKCWEAHISFAELERRVGLGNGTLGRWDSKKSSPTVDSIKKVANYFGCTIDELIKEE